MNRAKAMRATSSITAAGFLASAAIACSAPTDTGPARAQGIVEMSVSASSVQAGGDYAAITAPDTVQVGVAFTATITTIGPSLCWRAAGMDVGQGPALVVARPYDRHSGSEFCAGALVELPRSISITFTQTGDALIRVRGRRMVDGVVQEGVEVSVDKIVVVK